MSKFKVGDRVITLKCKLDSATRFAIGTVGIICRIYDVDKFGDYNIGVYNTSLDTTYFYAEDELELNTDTKIYKTGFEDGAREAWDVAKRICDNAYMQMLDCFGCDAIKSIFENLSPDEALAKIEEYEKNHICVGDIVKHPNNPNEYIVIDISNGDAITTDFTRTEYIALDQWEKTGRSVDISKLVALVNKDVK